MKNSEVFDNLSNAVKTLLSLIPEGLDSIVNEEDAEHEQAFLMERAGYLSYTELDGFYNEGISTYVDRNLSECEIILICGVGLLTEYGLSPDELVEWIDRQHSPFKELAYPLVDKEIPGESLEAIEAEFKHMISSSIFNNRELSLEQRNGMEYMQEMSGISDKHFRFLDDYIVYHSDFERYCSLIKQFKEIVGNGILSYYYGEFESTIEETGACDEKFFDTLVDLIKALEEQYEEELRDLTKILRQNKCDPSDIQSFRSFFNEKSLGYQATFIEVLTPLVDFYEQNYPGNEQNSHVYLNYLATLREMRRNIGVATLDIPSAQKEIAYTANKVVSDIGKSAVGTLIDGFFNIDAQVTFGIKMRKVLKSEDFYYGLLDLNSAFEEEILPEYFAALRSPNYDIFGYVMATGTAQSLRDSFFNESDTHSKKDEVAFILKDAALDQPFDPEIYSLAYLYFGDEAGELDAISEFLDISSEYHQKMTSELDKYCYEIMSKKEVLGDDVSRLQNLADSVSSYNETHSKWSDKITLLINSIQARIDQEQYIHSHDASPDGVNCIYYNFLKRSEAALSNNEEWIIKRGHPLFNEYYEMLAPCINQSVFGPIGLIYKAFNPEGSFVVFTPEKNFLVIDGAVADSFSFCDLGYNASDNEYYTAKNLMRLGQIAPEKFVLELNHAIGEDSMRRIKFLLANLQLNYNLSNENDNDCIEGIVELFSFWVRASYLATEKNGVLEINAHAFGYSTDFTEHEIELLRSVFTCTYSGMNSCFRIQSSNKSKIPVEIETLEYRAKTFLYSELKDEQKFELLLWIAKEANIITDRNVINKENETEEQARFRRFLLPALANLKLSVLFEERFRFGMLLNAAVFETHQQLEENYNKVLETLKEYDLYGVEDEEIFLNREYNYSSKDFFFGDRDNYYGNSIRMFWGKFRLYPSCRWEDEVFRSVFPSKNPFGDNVSYVGESKFLRFFYIIPKCLAINEKILLLAVQKKPSEKSLVLTDKRIIWDDGSVAILYSKIERIELVKRFLSTVVVINGHINIELNQNTIQQLELFVDRLRIFVEELKKGNRSNLPCNNSQASSDVNKVEVETAARNEDLRRKENALLETPRNQEASEKGSSDKCGQSVQSESEEDLIVRMRSLTLQAGAVWQSEDNASSKLEKLNTIAREAGIIDQDGHINKEDRVRQQRMLRLSLLPVMANTKIKASFNGLLFNALVYKSHQQLIANYNTVLSIVKEFGLYANEEDGTIGLNHEYDDQFTKKDSFGYYLSLLCNILNHYPVCTEGEVFRRYFSEDNSFGSSVFYAGEDVFSFNIYDQLLANFLSPNERFMLFVCQQEDLKKGLVLTDKRIIWSGVNGTEAIPFTDIKGISTKKRLLSSNILINGQIEISLFGMQNQDLFIKLLCEYIIALRKESESPTAHPQRNSNTKADGTAPPEQTEKQEKNESPGITDNRTLGEATQSNRGDHIPLSALSDAEVSAIVSAIMQRFDVNKCFAVGTQEYQAKIAKAMSAYASFTRAERPMLLEDQTIFGSAKEGIVLTDKAIYCKPSFEKKAIIPISVISKIYTERNNQVNLSTIYLQTKEGAKQALSCDSSEQRASCYASFWDYIIRALQTNSLTSLPEAEEVTKKHVTIK